MVNAEFRSERTKLDLFAFIKCGVCTFGSAVRAAPATAAFEAGQEEHISFQDHFMSHPEWFIIIDIYPEPTQPIAPAHLPSNVEGYFNQATHNIKIGPDAAGAMFRKCLDVGLKKIDPDGKGNLVNRIDAAAEKQLITPDLAGWSHHIRLEGNDASHDEDPYTPEEAQELYDFTDLVLRYLFTLPEEVKQKRASVTGEAEST